MTYLRRDRGQAAHINSKCVVSRLLPYGSILCPNGIQSHFYWVCKSQKTRVVNSIGNAKPPLRGLLSSDITMAQGETQAACPEGLALSSLSHEANT